jgi:hypothetical protein
MKRYSRVRCFFVNALFLSLGAVPICAFDIEEQAYVHVQRVSWCVKPEHRENGLLPIHRSPDCEYETLFGSKTISDVCDISTPEGWRTADEWTLLVKGPNMSDDPEIAPNDFFFYLSKKTLNDLTYYSISWNANDAGEPAYTHAQWILGEDYIYTKDPERDIHTIEGGDTEIVLNFEVSLQKYPQPEHIDLSTYNPEDKTNWDMLFTLNELIVMHLARIRQLMKLKIDRIKSDSLFDDWTVQNVEAALKTQEAWEAYASARSAETSAAYGNGSGAPVGGGSKYLQLLRERIDELRSHVLK